jgi:plasmid stabilization system protein ParE
VTADMLDPAGVDLERAFDYYQQRRNGLGIELVGEFRRAVDLVLAHPRAWQPLDDIYRRCRLHRFPYGVIYRIDEAADKVVIVAVMHLSEQPDAWRARARDEPV